MLVASIFVDDIIFVPLEFVVVFVAAVIVLLDAVKKVKKGFFLKGGRGSFQKSNFPNNLVNFIEKIPPKKVSII